MSVHVLHLDSDYVGVNYTLLSYTAACVFYDSNASTFAQSGCRVGLCSSPLATQCLCTHLTSFSNAFYVPQSGASASASGSGGSGSNMNPFSASGASAFSLTSLSQNPVALALCVACLCAYLIAVLAALRFDIRDSKRVPHHFHVVRVLQNSTFSSASSSCCAEIPGFAAGERGVRPLRLRGDGVHESAAEQRHVEPRVDRH